MPRTATADHVSREQLLAFLRPRHRALLTTRRSDGSPQLSPVAAGVDAEGRVVVSTYPQRAEVRDVQRDPRVSLCFLSDDWDDARVQVDGRAEVLAPPEALDASVDDDRGIAGEHPDWDDYRAAMVRQGRVLLRVTVERWGRSRRGASRRRSLPAEHSTPGRTVPRVGGWTPDGSRTRCGRPAGSPTCRS